MEFISKSEQKTLAFAKKYSATLKGGEVILLCGNLGAGKSVFARGLAAGLKIKNRVTSPTFVLMKVYKVLKNKSITDFVHVDAYRVSAKDLFAIGIEEYLNNPRAVVIIEWGEKVEKEFKKKKIKFNKIKIQIIKTQRKIYVN
jgi:tRNA threonylcarbamoyladenosine biosynthesis protein TsaE